MNISFDKTEMVNALPPLMCGVAGKTAIPACECIHLIAKEDGQLILCTYDTEKGARVVLNGTVREAGEAVIAAQKFNQIVKTMDRDTIDMTVSDRNIVTFRAGDSVQNMLSLNPSDFPDIPPLTTSTGFRISQRVLKKMIAKCSFCIGVNDQRVNLNGMYININQGRLSCVACDSFKMAVLATDTELTGVTETALTKEIKLILPNKSVAELFRLLSDREADDEQDGSVLLYTSRKYLVAVFGEVTFYSKLIEADYMDFRRVLTLNQRVSVDVSREALLGALERAALITEEKVSGAVRSGVCFTIKGETLEVTAKSALGSSFDSIGIIHQGEDLTITFNNRYLIDCMRAADCETVHIELSTPLNAIFVKPCDEEMNREDRAGDEELYMILPIRTRD